MYDSVFLSSCWCCVCGVGVCLLCDDVVCCLFALVRLWLRCGVCLCVVCVVCCSVCGWFVFGVWCVCCTVMVSSVYVLLLMMW